MMKKLFVFIFFMIPLLGWSQTYDRANLKERFETGDIPTQQDFSDLIDSFQNLNEDGSSAVDTVNDIATKYDLTQVQGGGSGDLTAEQLSDTAQSVRNYVDNNYQPINGDYSTIGSQTITQSGTFIHDAGGYNFYFKKNGTNVFNSASKYTFIRDPGNNCQIQLDDKNIHFSAPHFSFSNRAHYVGVSSIILSDDTTNIASVAYASKYLASKKLPAYPTASQDGQALRWNNGSGAWEYFTPSGGSGDSYKSGSLTDGAPTNSQLNSVIGITPATVGAGHEYKVKDTDGSGQMYIVVSDGSNWHYSVMNLAN